MGLVDIEISTHAPREGSDDKVSKDVWAEIVISTHAPREGSDLFYRVYV